MNNLDPEISLGVFSLKRPNVVPHEQNLLDLWQNSFEIPIYTTKQQFSISNVDTSITDYTNVDADMFFFNDWFYLDKILSESSKLNEYFGGMLLNYQIDGGHFFKSGVLDTTKIHKSYQDMTIQHMMNSLFRADSITCVDYSWERVMYLAKDFFSSKVIAELESKVLLVPPTGYYKVTPTDYAKDFSTLRFLWNHRLGTSKRPELFFGIINEFHKKYPQVPISVEVISHKTSDATLKQYVPKELHYLTSVIPFTYSKTQYQAYLDRSNCHIGTSEYESFGISILEMLVQNYLVLNVSSNKSYATFTDGIGSFHYSDIADQLYKSWTDSDYRDTIIKSAKNALLGKFPDKTEYHSLLKSHFLRIFNERLDRISTDKDNSKVSAVLSKLDEVPYLDKAGVYDAFGWKDPSLPKFWPTYYYALRKHGVQVTRHNDVNYFYTGDIPEFSDIQSSTTAIDDLFTFS